LPFVFVSSRAAFLNSTPQLLARYHRDVALDEQFVLL